MAALGAGAVGSSWRDFWDIPGALWDQNPPLKARGGLAGSSLSSCDPLWMRGEIPQKSSKVEVKTGRALLILTQREEKEFLVHSNRIGEWEAE